LSQQGFIAEDHHVGEFDSDVGVGPAQVGIGLHHAPEQAAEVQRRYREVLADDFVVVEGIGDQVVQAVGGIADAVEVVQRAGRQGVGEFVLQHSGKALHGPEGRAHVVDHAVGHVLQFGQGFVQLGGALLHCLLQMFLQALEFGNVGDERECG
jgi:hypothetical protein